MEKYMNEPLNFSVAKKHFFFFVWEVFGMSSTTKTLHLTDKLQRLSKAKTHCPSMS